MNLPTLLLLGTLMTGTIGGTVTGYVHYDELRTQVSENTTARLLNTWQRLNAIKKQRRLTVEQFIALCDAGKRLGIIESCKEIKK